MRGLGEKSIILGGREGFVVKIYRHDIATFCHLAFS